MPQSSNKKIAINTIYMYARLFITMAIGLYTSRVVLLILGVSDYGLFNVVGGIVALFGFISNSLGAASARFLNAEMGKPGGDVNRIYNINFTLHIIFSAILFILAESIGLWYVLNNLSIAPGKLSDALFVYQVSIITACIGIISTPCSSIFSAKEKFGFLSILDIINTIVRLLCVIALQYYKGNSLRFYSLIMSFTTINSFVIYYWLSIKWWPSIVKWRFIRGWNNYRPVLSFGSWNLLSTASMMARNTGTDLVLNSFFGTITNGVYAISRSVSNYVTIFSSNFDSASAPQIIQSYNSGDFQRSNYLVNKMGRFCLLLFELVLFPLWIELDFILHLWLKNVPDGVLFLCKLNLILAAVSLSGGGIVTLINASGKIKWFKIEQSICFLLCIPLGILLFKIGFPDYTIMVLFILADLIQRLIQLVLLKKLLLFNSLHFTKEAYLRPIIIAIIMGLFVYGYSLLSVESIWLKVLAILITFFVTAFVIYTYGLYNDERKKISQKILTFIKKGNTK